MKRMLWILNPHAGRGAMSGKIIGWRNAHFSRQDMM